MDELAAERLREILDYDPATGVFAWRVGRGYVKAGAVAGCVNGGGYWRIGIEGCVYYSHRLAWLLMTGVWPTDQIDHINGIRGDNRWTNLREVTNTINGQNMRNPMKNSTHGFLGVSPSLSKWKAEIQVGGKKKYLGSFATPEEAHAAYLAAKRKLHIGCMI